MSRQSADSLVTTIWQKRNRAEAVALVEAHDAEIATEAAAREREACAAMLDARGAYGDENMANEIRARQEPQGRVPTAGELAHDYIDNTLNSVVKP